MSDLAAGEDMEWESTVILTPEQVGRLNSMKEKATRIRRARLQQKEFREGVARRYMLAELGSWIWGALDTHMESSKRVTFIDTPNIQVRASMNIMVLATVI